MSTTRPDLGTPLPRVVESFEMVETATYERSWRVRLCTWPWRPWQRYRTVTRPSKRIVHLPSGTLLMHPATHAALKAARKGEAK